MDHYQSTGEMCAAKFVDEEWYRAKIEKMSGENASVLYLDYGNRWVSVGRYKHDRPCSVGRELMNEM